MLNNCFLEPLKASSESTSLLKNQEGMRSSNTMQTFARMPSVGHQLHAPQQTSCSRVPSPTVQAQCYIAQQRMSSQLNNQQCHGLWNSQSSSQPASDSSNLQSRQMSHEWFTDSQNQLLLRNSASMRATLSNGQFAPLAAAQHGTPTQNISHHPQTLNRNTAPPQNYNMLPLHNVSSKTTVSWFPSVNSSVGSAIGQNNLMPVLPLYQSSNGNRMKTDHQPAAQLQQTDLPFQINQAEEKIHNNQGWIRGGNGNSDLLRTVHHIPPTSQRLITPSQPSNSHQTGQSHTSYYGNQVKHSSQIQHQSSSYRTENNSASYSNLKHSRNKPISLTSNLPHPPSYTSQHFVIESQPNQRIKQSCALSLPQDNVQPQTPLQQCNTIQVSDDHTKTYDPIVADSHGNTQQLNNTVTGLLRSSQVTIPSNAPTYTGFSLDYSQVTLMDLLVKDNTQLPAQSHDTSPLSCPKASFTTQAQIPSHITTKANYSQTPEFAPYCSVPAILHSKEPHRVSEYQTCVQRTDILKENEHVLGNQLKAPDVQSFEGMQSRRLQTDSNIERIDRHQSNNNGHGKVKYTEDVAESLELVMALQKVFRQSHKAVAVVPPISQQICSPEKDDNGTPSSDDSLPFKISTVWTVGKESKDVDQESNAPSLPKETIEEFLQFSSVPHPDKKESNKHEDGFTVDNLIPDTQSADIPYSKIYSTTSQHPVCSNVLTLKIPEDHKKVRNDNTNDHIFDLSKVQVHNFTLKKFICFVKVLENSPKGGVKEPVSDVGKCILDLYWDGKKENLVTQIHAFHTELASLYSKVSIKEIQTAIFQYLKRKDLKMLEHGYHILKNDTNLLAEEFKSSWLNIDGQPADIENVLAQPISDFNLADYALYKGFETLNIYSESDPSSKVILSTTDCHSDKELVNSQVCGSKSTDEVSNTQEASKKQEDEKAEKHKQNVHLNPEESVDLNEITDTLMETKSHSDKELVNSQVCESKSTDEVSNMQGASKNEDKNLEKHLQQDVNLNPEESIDSNELPHTLTESKRNTECEQVCIDAYEDITSSSEFVEERGLSNDLDSSNDFQLIKLSVLSADDARTIFKEYSGCDLQKEPSQLCRDETKISDNLGCKSANRNKFTCPHVTDIDWDGVHFCPRCWEDTPLLDLDLEEALFSPNGDSPDMRSPPHNHHNPSCRPQPGNPDSNCTQFSENSSIADSPAPKVDAFEVTMSEPDSNPLDAVESCTSLSGKSPVKEPHVPVCTESVSFTMPIKEQSCETSIAMGPLLPMALSYAQNLDIPEWTKTTRDENFPPKIPPCKKVKLTKTTEIPADDDLFTTDIVTKCKWVNICSQRSSDSSNSSTYGVNMSVSSPDSILGNLIQSCSLSFGKSPDKETPGRACSESVRVTMPINKQVCEAGILSGAQLPKALFLTQNTEKRKPVMRSQTMTSREKVSPLLYPPYEKAKATKTISIPTTDDLFTPDDVVKKTSSPKPSTEGGQNHKDHKDEKMKLNQHFGQIKTVAQGKWKKPSVASQVPNITPQLKRSAIAANFDTNTKKVLGKTKVSGLNKGMKKRKFALYGVNNGNQDRNVQQQFTNRTKSSSAPVYITISNRPEAATSYTDAPSAKQKVYSHWSSTFVETEKNTSSHKKHQKHVKAELKSRTQALKRLLEDRLAIKREADGAKCKQSA